MKRNAMPQAPACLPKVSADKAHADEGSRDRLYWRYGYFTGLKQALTMLANRAATLH